jgi:hypothetical protein
MTTHDYSGDTSSPAPVDAATASADPTSERLITDVSSDESVVPDRVTDPSWQRQADHFAATRDQLDRDGSPPAQSDSATPVGGEEFDDGRRSGDLSSMDDSLFAGAELEKFRGEWNSVQAGFVDDPQRCVERADGLVSDVVELLSNSFAQARSRLEQQWSRGEKPSTEDLRVALKRYREFFDRLLAV